MLDLRPTSRTDRPSANAARRRRALSRYVARRAGKKGYSFEPGALAGPEGLIGGAAVALLVAVALVLRRPDFAWAPYAAFWTCLADPGGGMTRRLRAMTAFIVCGGLVAGLVSAFAAPAGLANGALLSALVGLLIYVGLSSSGMGGVGVLVGVVAVVAAEQPVGAADAVMVALVFFLGGALTMILCLATVACVPPTRRSPREDRAPPADPRTLSHALLAALAVMATYTAVHALSLAYPQWATVAAVVVVRPDVHASRRRTIERVAGSLIGAAAAAPLILAVKEPWALVPPIFLLAAAAITLRKVNYTLFVSFLTPLFIVIGATMVPSLAHQAAASRAEDNMIGSVLATLGCALVWGGWRLVGARLPRRLKMTG